MPLAVVGKIISVCKAKGLINWKNDDTVAGYNNVLTFLPPLLSMDEDVEFIVNTFKEVMNNQ